MKIKPFLLIGVILLGSFIIAIPILASNNTEDPITESASLGAFCDDIFDEINVCLEESVEYLKAESEDVRPVSIISGYLTWYNLAGVYLGFFLNTSDVIGEISVMDPKTSEPVAYQQLEDRLLISPNSAYLNYSFSTYYDPDFIGDTGFVVVFQSQVVNFGSAGESGVSVFNNVDYRNKIILPEGAGIVSLAPTGNAVINEEGTNIWSITWEYRNWEMDSYHFPVLTEVTYSFDQIYLHFTQILYQNLLIQQKLLEEQNRLDLINSSFQLIAIFSFLLAIISIFLAYLIARRRFEPEKKKAESIPRREAVDIENTKGMEISLRNLFTCGLIVSLMFFSPVAFTPAQTASDDIQWFGEFEIFKDNTIKLNRRIELPYAQSSFRIWENISKIDLNSIQIKNANGGNLDYSLEADHLLIEEAGTILEYEYIYEFNPHNWSGILVYLDRFWLEFVNLNQDPTVPDDTYLKADLDYQVVLPSDAIIYSASPSDNYAKSIDPDGRKRITFTDQDRQIDAFHDAWECQISYSFINIFEAINRIDDWEDIRIEQRQVTDIISVATGEVLIFGLIGVITPVLAFLVAYWVFRKKHKKEIERLQNKKEEQILIEKSQIDSFLKTQAPEDESTVDKVFLGFYYLLKTKLSNAVDKNIEIIGLQKLEAKLKTSSPNLDFDEISRLLQEGSAFEKGEIQSVSMNEAISYGRNVEKSLINL